MFILKFALEGSLLLGLFFIFRRFVFKSMGVSTTHETESQGSILSRAAYSFIFLFSGLVFSFMTFWGIYIAFNIFHSLGHFTGVLVAQQMGLLAPSLIIGFYISTQTSKLVYAHFFGAKSLLILPVIYGVTNRKVFTKVFSAITLIPAFLLIVLQFNVYLKIDGDKIYTRQILQEEKVYSLSDVVRIAGRGEDDFSLQMNNGEVIAVTAYSGNYNDFLDHLDW